ncbi:MAG: glycosyltransferase family 2 protein, partial [Pseudomonadota bacterium]|nr:glycosyltransferase family 2 protein [Pseudomonadota bacterium]
MSTNANNDAPLVSVIIPAFNAAAHIDRTIQTVLAQTYLFYEILVVDDGSSDGTSDVVIRQAEGDGRIRLLRQENQGVSAARNHGIRQAKGDYIALLDADDIWFPEKLEKQVRVMRDSPPTVGLVYTWSARVSEDGRKPVLSNGWEEEGAVFLPLLLGNFLQNASTPLIRRECFDHVGMYGLDFHKLNAQGCEDWDIYLRIAEHYEFRVVPEHLVGYWQSMDSMSADWRLMDRSYRVLIDGVKKRHPEIPDFVYRWSKSNYLLYLAIRAARAQQTTASLWLLSQTTALDPFMLTNRRLQRTLAKNLIHRILSIREPSRSTGKQKSRIGE